MSVAFPHREWTVRIGSGKLHIFTDEVGIRFRWIPPQPRHLRVIDGELVGVPLPRAEVIPHGVGDRMFADKTCLDCENEWRMHHRCPAHDGRYVCC